MGFNSAFKGLNICGLQINRLGRLSMFSEEPSYTAKDVVDL